MSAKLYPMTNEQQAFLNCVRWLELEFDERVFVMDIDFEESTLSLYGHPKENANFNKKLKTMMATCRDSIQEDCIWAD